MDALYNRHSLRTITAATGFYKKKKKKDLVKLKFISILFFWGENWFFWCSLFSFYENDVFLWNSFCFRENKSLKVVAV